ncbi:MAG TPA: hypothetical protein ENK70_02430 [Methylophaga sp.]|nr:hypothetical protein [Methylophaga sp.]
MNNSQTPKSSAPNCPATNQRPGLAVRARKFIYALMAGTALISVACIDDETNTCQAGTGAGTSTPVQPDMLERGSSCVTVLNQNDEAMQNCRPTFEIDQKILDEDAAYFEKWGEGETPENPCTDDEHFVYGTPGTYNIGVECNEPASESLDKPEDKLAGHVNVDIKGDEGVGEHSEHSSHLIDSFCTDGYEFVADPQNTSFMLNDHLGRSTATWCANEFSEQELLKIEVVDLVLDCSNLPDCDPTDGRHLLIPHGILGQYSDGNPKHLTFTAQTDLVPNGEEYIVWITLMYNGDPSQQYNVAVKIRGAGGAGGAE